MSKLKAEWYQNGDFVTASVKLRRLAPSQTRGEVKPIFEEQYCAIYEGGSKTTYNNLCHNVQLPWSIGELFWESHLAGRIVPEKCKVVPGRVRVELKLKKAEPETWNDFEVRTECFPHFMKLPRSDPAQTIIMCLYGLELLWPPLHSFTIRTG